MKAKEIRASRMKYIDVMDKVKPVKFLPKLDVITIAGAAEYLETEPIFVANYYANHLKELQEYGVAKLFTNDFLNVGYTKDSQRVGSCDVLKYGSAEVRVSDRGARCISKNALFYMVLGMNCSEVVEKIKAAVVEAEEADSDTELANNSATNAEVSITTASDIQTFTNTEFGDVRVVDVNGDPWFVGKDVATALGYSNPNEAITDHIFENDKLNSKMLSSLGQRGGWLINESGLYSLIMSSKLPSANKFQRWVTSEVLPSIRKHGAYMTPATLMEAMQKPENIMALLEKLKDEQLKNRELEETLKVFSDEIKTWDNRTIIRTLVSGLTGKLFGSNFGMGFKYFYNQFDHKYGTKLSIRKPTGTSKSILDTLSETELVKGVRLAVILCRDNGVDVNKLINDVNAARIGS